MKGQRILLLNIFLCQLSVLSRSDPAFPTVLEGYLIQKNRQCTRCRVA